MKRINKHGKSWVFLTHPLGHDPYNSIDNSYMVNTDQMELVKLKTEIVDAFVFNQQQREKVAMTGLYTSTPVVAREEFERDELGLPVL